MRVLAIDASTDYLTAAVCDGPVVRAERTILAERRHAERIVDIIDATLSDSAVKLSELDLLAVTVGPGSFTGLRIGVSTMKGLAEGAGKPLVGVSTLAAMSHQVAAYDGLICPLLDARMDEIYGAVYRVFAGERAVVHPERVGPVESLLSEITEPVVVFGEGAIRYADRINACCPNRRTLPGLHQHPRAAAVAHEAVAAHAAGANADAALVRPVYLRQSQPEEARRAAREKATA